MRMRKYVVCSVSFLLFAVVSTQAQSKPATQDKPACDAKAKALLQQAQKLAEEGCVGSTRPARSVPAKPTTPIASKPATTPQPQPPTEETTTQLIKLLAPGFTLWAESNKLQQETNLAQIRINQQDADTRSRLANANIDLIEEKANLTEQEADVAGEQAALVEAQVDQTYANTEAIRAEIPLRKFDVYFGQNFRAVVGGPLASWLGRERFSITNQSTAAGGLGGAGGTGGSSIAKVGDVSGGSVVGSGNSQVKTDVKTDVDVTAKGGDAKATGGNAKVGDVTSKSTSSSDANAQANAKADANAKNENNNNIKVGGGKQDDKDHKDKDHKDGKDGKGDGKPH